MSPNERFKFESIKSITEKKGTDENQTEVC